MCLKVIILTFTNIDLFMFECSEHKLSLSHQNKRKWDSFQSHNKDFIDWFSEKVNHELEQGHQVPDHVVKLSLGPSQIAKKYTGYSINGYKFHTMKRDKNCVTDNSGVTLIAETTSFSSSKDKNPVVSEIPYYGAIEDIIEVHYQGNISVVLFKCVWFHAEKDANGLSQVNRNRCIWKNEPFILASQAHQVFYVEDPRRKNWFFAEKICN